MIFLDMCPELDVSSPTLLFSRGFGGPNGETMRGALTTVIDDRASLDVWRKQMRGLRSTGNLPAVRFELPELSSDQNRTFSVLCNRLQKACGCASGGLFMSVAAVVLAAGVFIGGDGLSDVDLMLALRSVGTLIVATAVGKLLGLLWARWRLLVLAARVHDLAVRAPRRSVAASS
jgi:hypothetical protein